jgi:hypothetical protein
MLLVSSHQLFMDPYYDKAKACAQIITLGHQEGPAQKHTSSIA